MSVQDQTELRQTILDRLAPLEDHRGEIGSRSPHEIIEDSIRRDVEMLLNTRREEFLVPPEFEQTAASIVNFGIPDFSKLGNLGLAVEQARLCHWIEEAISNFEPRLRDISVRVADRENVRPVLRFRVEAKAELTSERVAFELGLKRDNGELAVLRR
jgi:type VI secretion system protein ImpF